MLKKILIGLLAVVLVGGALRGSIARPSSSMSSATPASVR
jgi:hypothetical protein